MSLMAAALRNAMAFWDNVRRVGLGLLLHLDIGERTMDHHRLSAKMHRELVLVLVCHGFRPPLPMLSRQVSDPRVAMDLRRSMAAFRVYG